MQRAFVVGLSHLRAFELRTVGLIDGNARPLAPGCRA